jgi:AcrR family transcriptional regulator
MARPAKPRRGSRQQDSAATRDRLLKVGTRLLADRGLRRTRAGDVARAAGVAVGTLYLHFGDKDGLARAALSEAVDVLRARLRAAVAPHADDPEAAAHAHAEAILRFAEEQAPLARLVFATDLADRSLGTALLDRLAETQEKRLREGMADGEFRRDLDVAVTAQALVGMQARVVAWWLADRKRTPRAVVVDTLAKLRLTGLQPPHPKGTPR